MFCPFKEDPRSCNYDTMSFPRLWIGPEGSWSWSNQMDILVVCVADRDRLYLVR